jgi:hypothetical protein
MSNRSIAVALVLAALIGACSDSPTSVRFDLRAHEALQLDRLELAIGDDRFSVELEPELLVLLADATAGTSIPVVLEGLRGDLPLAHAETEITPITGEEVRTFVTLAPVRGVACDPLDGCLLLVREPKAFVDARAGCAASGSQLAILTDSNRDALARELAGTLEVFIGLTDTVTEGVFEWVDGTPLDFRNFAMGEPNDVLPGQDCVVIAGPTWDDRPCAADPNNPIPGVYPYLCTL